MGLRSRCSIENAQGKLAHAQQRQCVKPEISSYPRSITSSISSMSERKSRMYGAKTSSKAEDESTKVYLIADRTVARVAALGSRMRACNNREPALAMIDSARVRGPAAGIAPRELSSAPSEFSKSGAHSVSARFSK